MQPPTIIDSLLGNRLVFAGLWLGFIVMFILWMQGEAPNQYLPFILGGLAWYAISARRRVVADKRWQEERADVLGAGSRQPAAPARGWVKALRVIAIALVALPVGSVLFWFASGMLEHKGIDLAALVAEWTAPARAIAPDMRSPVTLAIAGLSVAAIAALAVGLRMRRRTRAGERSGQWDGTVTVLLPIPEEISAPDRGPDT